MIVQSLLSSTCDYVHEKQIYSGGRIALKGGLASFADLRGLGKKKGMVSLKGGCTPLQTMPPPHTHKNETFIATIINICMSCFFI